MASSSTPNSSSEKYPFPLGIKVRDIFSFKLSRENYITWRPLMIGLIKIQGLISFINGEVSAPPKTVTVPAAADDGSPDMTREIENPEHEAWERTDALLRSWILGTVSEDLLPNLVRLATVKDMWTTLEKVLTLQKTTISSTTVVPNKGEPNTEAAGKETHNLSRYQPLRQAAMDGDWESAKEFLKNEPDAVRAFLTSDSETLLTLAIFAKRGIDFVEKVVELMSPYDVALVDDEGYTALHIAAIADNIEAAKLLVEKNPQLPNFCDNDGLLPIHYATLAGLRRMFLFLWDRTNKYIESKPLEDDRGACLINGQIRNNHYDIVKQKFNGIFWKLTEILVPQMKYIREIKREHNQAHQLVKHLCSEIKNLKSSKKEDILQQSLIAAAEVGISEVVEEIFAICSTAFDFKNAKGQNVFHVAILNRHENVFNLIYQVRDDIRPQVFSNIDSFNMTPLDSVASLKSEQRINIRASAAGAALQLQRELQWYEEVEKLTFKAYRGKFDSEKASPRMVFSETHEELIKEGERWMKGTANSCTIIAALIATIVFAAAITMPGGNNSLGHPIFSKNKAFSTFGISNAVAFFLSTSSLLVFLSITTSRYAEEDFLKVLPRRLIIGLTTLFFSIISILIAFSAILYLVFGDGKAWILAPIIALACVPGIQFVSSQFPLLFDMVKYTYRIGVFCKQSDRIFF